MNEDQHVCTVAVDVGNTAVKLAVRHAHIIADRSIPIHIQCWPSEAIDWVSGQLGCQNIRWLVSSVHRSAAVSLIHAIENRVDVNRPLPPEQIEPQQGKQPPRGGGDLVQVIHHQDVPMPVRVDDPATLGIDRLLGAFAAVNLPDTDLASGGLVIIDAGSAITVDWVDCEGCFRGGAILPGLRLQAKSLATGTDALPEIDWNRDQQASLPGTNTRDAIFGGILLGAAGAIDALAQHYLNQQNSDQENSDQENRGPSSVPMNPANKNKIVLTGGDAVAISAHLECPHQCVPHLVCHGLLQLDDCSRASKNQEDGRV